MPEKKEQSKEELVADAIYALAKEVRFLGFGGASRKKTGIGAVESLANHLFDSNKEIAAAIHDVASSISEVAAAIQSLSESIAERGK